MTFLEFFLLKEQYPFALKLSKSEKASISTNTSSIGGVNHRHQKTLPGENQVNGKTKNVNMVARYLTKQPSIVSTCIQTKMDQPLSFEAALGVCKDIFNDTRAMPTPNSREKGLRETGVYLVLNPDNKTYRLTFRGVQNGKS